MRAPVFDATFRGTLLLAVLATAFAATSASPQQSQQLPNPPSPITRNPTLPGGPPGNDDDPMVRHMTEALAKSHNIQRQQQLVADTTKLLQLATELKAEVDKSNKDTLSLGVVKKAEEIEKLAKSVKEKMRDGQ